MKVLLLFTGLAAVRAQSSYYGGGLDDKDPDTCYRAIEFEIKEVTAQMEKHWKDHYHAECKKTEERDRVELELEMLASELFTLGNNEVRCGDNCDASAYQSNDVNTIINKACDSDGVVTMTSADTITATFDGAGQDDMLAQTGIAPGTAGDDGRPRSEVNDEPTRPSDANYIAAKNDLKDYAEATVKYCYEVFRIDQNLQALMKVNQNQILDAHQGGHFFLQMNQKQQGKGRANATALVQRRVDACAAAAGRTDCEDISIEQEGGMRPQGGRGGVPYCTWTGTECLDSCYNVQSGMPDAATCQDHAGHCRAESDGSSDCMSMMYDIDLELRKCMDAKFEVESKAAHVEYQKAALDEAMTLYQMDLEHWLVAQQERNVRKEQFDGYCRKTKAARLVRAELDATALDQDDITAYKDTITALRSAQAQLENPDFRHWFSLSASPQSATGSFVVNPSSFIQEAMTKTVKSMAKDLNHIAKKTGVQLASNLASFIQKSSSSAKAPVALGDLESTVTGTIMYAINSRLSMSMDKGAQLEAKRLSCESELAEEKINVALASSEFDAATLNVHKMGAKVEEAKVALKKATDEYTAASDAYSEADADFTKWTTDSQAELQEAQDQASQMATQISAMVTGLQSAQNDGGEDSVPPMMIARLENICTRAQAAVQNRYVQLSSWQSDESTRQSAIVDRLEAVKDEASTAKTEASTHLTQVSTGPTGDFLGVEDTDPADNDGTAATDQSTGSRHDRNEARRVFSAAMKVLHDKQEECMNFLEDVQERIDEEARQVQGLNELKGVLSQLMGDDVSSRTASAEDWETITAGISETANNCLQHESKSDCELEGNNECIFYEGLLCYPNLQGADGAGTFGTTRGEVPAGDLKAAGSQNEGMLKDFFDDLKDKAQVDNGDNDDYAGTSRTGAEGDLNDPIDFGDGYNAGANNFPAPAPAPAP